MNRILLPLVLVLALGAAIGYYLHIETGYVLVSYHSWIIESSVLGALAGAVLLLLALVWGARLLVALVRLPGTLREFMGARRQRRARESFGSGLQKWLEGRWPEAELELLRRAADHETPGLNYLLAARAAQQAGAPERSEQYLDQAALQNDATAFAARQLRAEMQIKRAECWQALPVLRELHKQEPGHPQVARLLCEALAASGIWSELHAFLKTGDSAKALPTVTHQRFSRMALRELLLQAAGDARLDTLRSLWGNAPVSVRSSPEVRLAYVRGLGRLGADAEAGALIETVLRQEWDPALVEAHSDLDGLDAVSQLANVEHWLVQHGEKPELLLAAGRVCTRNQLWGKARSYLDASLKLSPSPAVYLALARLSDASRSPADAAQFFREGLELAARSRS